MIICIKTFGSDAGKKISFLKFRAGHLVKGQEKYVIILYNRIQNWIELNWIEIDNLRAHSNATYDF